MQISLISILLIIIIFIIFTLSIIFRKEAKLTAPCPECGSIDVLEINRETTGSRTLQIVGPGSDAGGDIRLQLDFAIDFTCQQCGHKFTRNFTQTR